MTMRLLTLDIETCPIDAYVWGIWQQNIATRQIKAPMRMLSWAAKWEDEDEVMYCSERIASHEEMVLQIYELVNQADAIVHYNGQNYDMKHLNREFIEIGLAPPSPYKNIDLLVVVKRMFKFPSNKLEYVAGVLLGEHKLETGGMDLWIQCLKGNKKAWQVMEDYNVQDVVLTEKLYHHVQGWIPSHPNRGLWIEEGDLGAICPNCGSRHLVKKGVERPARVNAYQRYKCKDCGANSRGRSVIAKASDSVLM